MTVENKKTPITQANWDSLVESGVNPEDLNFRVKGKREKNILHAPNETQEKYREIQKLVKECETWEYNGNVYAIRSNAFLKTKK
jgi:hypothetical protein|tara:strand:- start:8826 stop:9077 length:252 start_codon:yes stop_codon:yes gene_type:complete